VRVDFHGSAASRGSRWIRIAPALLQPIECDTLRRLGAVNDGGYVVPVQAIQHASALLSFGLAHDWSFERAAAALNPNLRVEAYDHSVGRALFLGMAVKSTVSVHLRLLALSPAGASASARRVARAMDYFRFFSGRHRHQAKRIWYNTDDDSANIEDVLDAMDSAPISIFAKVDIEGTEYHILPALIARAPQLTGMVIEFHHTDICSEIFTAQMRLLRECFEVVHVHGNNFADLNEDHTLPLSLEISFLNKALLTRAASPYRGPLPRPGLDAPNNPRRADYVLDLGMSATPLESAS